jgi:PKD repeat protein
MSRGNRVLLVPVVLATMLLASQGAFAFNACLQEFTNTYPDSQSDDVLGSAPCLLCHTTSFGGPFNSYGNDLATRGATCGSSTFADLLASVEGIDSDHDGTDVVHSNLAEITAGTQPGWCVPDTPGCNNAVAPPSGIKLDPDAPAPEPGNTPPIASAGGPYSGVAGTTLIQFSGSGSDPDGDPISFTWHFGDDTTASGMMPTHTYSTAGNYTVELVVEDDRGGRTSAVTSAEITAPIVNLAPVADPGGPYNGETGVEIRFDGSGSTDPNDDALFYNWNFGDGATGTGATPTHAYAMARAYEVRLIVNDGELESAEAVAKVEVVDVVEGQPDDSSLYEAYCAGCHGDPWASPAIEETLPGLRRVAGARACNIAGSISGTSVFPDGVLAMRGLGDILTTADIEALAEYLNSQETSGEQRYVTTCAGCHGNDGSGGRVGEDVHGESAEETWEAIYDEDEMNYMACMPRSDIEAIADFLGGRDDDFDDDGIRDDDDDDDDNDGIRDEDDDDDDNDGRSDDDEREDGTDPRDDDSDDDGVNDGDEHEDGTDPRDADTDDDGLDDGDERDRGTDPKNPDTDGDGKSDGEEVNVLGTNPLVAESTGADDSSGGGGTTGLPMLLTLLALLRRRLYR